MNGREPTQTRRWWRRAPGFGPLAAVLLLGAGLGGCSRAEPPPGAAAALKPPAPLGYVVQSHVSGRDFITAAPAHARAHSSTAAMTITWAAPGVPSTQIRVSAGGAPAQLFAGGSQFGSATAGFIGPGQTYVFGLYPSSAARVALATVVVKGR